MAPQFHATAVYSRYALEMKLGGPRSWSGFGGEEEKKNSSCTPVRNRTAIV